MNTGKCEICSIPIVESVSKIMEICEYCLKDQMVEIEDLWQDYGSWQNISWEDGKLVHH